MEFVILSFSSLFVIVDPIGLIPTFLAMTPRNTQPERVRIAALASFLTFIILCLSAVGGESLFRIFGITLPAFEIAGGIVLLLVGLDMLRARRTEVRETQEEQVEGTEKESIAATPLAMPMLAGPGAITTVVLLASRVGSPLEMGVLLGNIALVSLLTFAILYVAAHRASALGVIGLKIITRFMGMILASIAIQFILNGIRSSHLFF